MHRYTPPSLICGLVTFMWLTVVPSDMVYWLERCPLSRGMGSSSSAQVTVGGGAPLAAHIRENCSPGLTTFSLKEETMRGVPSGGHPAGRGSGSGSHRQQQSPAGGTALSSHRRLSLDRSPAGDMHMAVPASLWQGDADRGEGTRWLM